MLPPPINQKTLGNLRPLTPELGRKYGKIGAKRANEVKREKRRAMDLTSILKERVEQEVDKLFGPYFSALGLEVDPEWSPATKLAFFIDQVGVSEKVLNRTEGMPVTRTRMVDREGNDREALRSTPTAALVDILSQALAPIREHDGEVVEVEDAELVDDPPGGSAQPPPSLDGSRDPWGGPPVF